MWLGSLKCHLGERAPFNIAWPEQYVFALGVAFAYDSTTSFKINFEDKLVMLRSIFNQWTTRNLTVIGRICIVKTLAISKLVTRARQPEVSFWWHSFLLFFVSQLAMHACVVQA